MKGGQQSSRASRGDMRTVVIEDIKGNTTITRVMGTNYHTIRPNIPIGEEGRHLHLLGDISGPRMSESVLLRLIISITTVPTQPTWC